MIHQLVDEPGAEQDEHERAPRGQGEPRTPATAISASGTSVTKLRLEPDDGAGDDRADRRGEPVEELVEVAGEARLDVGDRERQHQHEAGQHEAEAGGEAAELAAAQAAEVDAELVRLGAREHLVDGERLAEGLLRRPSPPRRRTRP